MGREHDSHSRRSRDDDYEDERSSSKRRRYSDDEDGGKDRNSELRQHHKGKDRDGDESLKHYKKKRKYRREENEDAEEDSESEPELPEGVGEIDESDFFLKANEFKVWLVEEKKKYFDKLSGDDARRYFKKFVKAWNRAKLNSKFYSGINPESISASATSSYKWSFSTSKKELDQARSVRESISSTGDEPGPKPVLGPSLPPSASASTPGYQSLSALQESREAAREALESEREAGRMRDRVKRKEARDEERDNRATGRDRLQEKRMEKRMGNKDFANRKDDWGDEFDDETLMGTDSTSARPVAANNRRQSKREAAREEKQAALNERAHQFRAKEAATMAMFKQMAEAKFGPSPGAG